MPKGCHDDGSPLISSCSYSLLFALSTLPDGVAITVTGSITEVLTQLAHLTLILINMQLLTNLEVFAIAVTFAVLELA